MILAACFINDFGTVLALGVFFANFNRWMVLFVVVMAVMLYFLPSWTRGIIKSLGETRVSEPEVKFLFLVLFFLGGLATMAKSEAGEAVGERCDQGPVTQIPDRADRYGANQPTPFVGVEYRCLTGLNDMPRPSHR